MTDYEKILEAVGKVGKSLAKGVSSPPAYSEPAPPEVFLDLSGDLGAVSSRFRYQFPAPFQPYPYFSPRSARNLGNTGVGAADVVLCVSFCGMIGHFFVRSCWRKNQHGPTEQGHEKKDQIII